MPPDLEEAPETDLKDKSILDSLSPRDKFYLLLVIIINFTIIVIYFLYINQNNPEIQKQILSILPVIVGGGAGGYILGSKIKI